ncbi:MAG: hypothetical protein HOD06_02510 [Candidatus Komeilibacteria bacterium]|jgi:hypothetical protein|nr:hypothetical protein [Candidatus Komeilibacteria bacterium]
MVEKVKYFIKKIRHHFPQLSPSSNLGEEKVIKKYLKYIKRKDNYCVDIAASDGMTQSNTLFLYKKNWGGLAVEFDSKKFAILSSHYKKFPNVTLMKVKVTPDNVLAILKSSSTPKNFTFLNLDIDSYDYFVLDKLLSDYRPRLICSEINEKIPPPIKFTVKYSPNHYWQGDHFYGQSISQLYKLCRKYKYKLVALHYCNAFLMPQEITGPQNLSPRLAYDDGYRNKVDRKKKFPWNKDMEELQHMPTKKGIDFINNKFSEYQRTYVCR